MENSSIFFSKYLVPIMAKRWSTKEDMLKDLEQVSGRRVHHHVEDGYLLYGEQPPPRRPLEEDDEVALRFGSSAAQGLGDGTPGPDLIGITKMLRMVQQYENSSDEERPLTPDKKIVIEKGNSKKSTSAEQIRAINLKCIFKSPNKKNMTCASPKMATNREVISHTGGIGDTGDSFSPIDGFPSNARRESPISPIVNSKLNPNVKEFIPKSAQFSRNSQTTEDNLSCASAACAASGDRNTKVDMKILKTDFDIGGETQDNTDKKTQMAIMLKKQISTKNNTHREQQQTHRAIVNLLKLYADPKPAKPVKLLTPDFFATSKVDSKIATDKESNKINSFLNGMVSAVNNVDKVDVDQNSKISRTVGRPMALEQFKVTSKNDDLDDHMIFNENGMSENNMSFSDKNINLENKMTYVDKNDDLENIITYNDKKDDLENNMSYNDKKDDLENNMSYNDKKDDLENNMSNDDKKDDLENNMSYDDKKDDFENNISCDKNGAIYNKFDQDDVNTEHVKVNEEEPSQLTPDMGEISLDEVENGKDEAFMEESCTKKVNNWFDKSDVIVPEKSKSPSPYLGAVAYKRKDPLTCKSPEITGKKVSKPSEFKPSNYAEELLKKYSEHNKTVNPTPAMNIWEKLEADLKKKDLDLKNRKKKA